jgi:hypothetical protein
MAEALECVKKWRPLSKAKIGRHCSALYIGQWGIRRADGIRLWRYSTTADSVHKQKEV